MISKIFDETTKFLPVGAMGFSLSVSAADPTNNFRKIKVIEMIRVTPTGFAVVTCLAVESCSLLNPLFR